VDDGILIRARKIAFFSHRNGNTQIYVMKANGSDQRRLTRNRVDDGDPAWSPNGRKIAYDGPGGIYVMNADGSNQRRLTK
jgi:Tol biopolymer transport system component